MMINKSNLHRKFSMANDPFH